MNNESSLEIFRAVYIDKSQPFFQPVTAFKRETFDELGDEVVASRSDNQVHLAKRSGARAYGEEELRFYHAWVTSQNRRARGKINHARERMEEGTASTGLYREASLDCKLRHVRSEEFWQDPDDVIDVVFDKVNYAAHPLRQRALFVLKASQDSNDNFELLQHMHGTTRDALAKTRAIAKMTDSPFVGSVPFAETRVHDPLKFQQFAELIGELLPIRAQLSPEVDFRTEY